MPVPLTAYMAVLGAPRAQNHPSTSSAAGGPGLFFLFSVGVILPAVVLTILDCYPVFFSLCV